MLRNRKQPQKKIQISAAQLQLLSTLSQQLEKKNKNFNGLTWSQILTTSKGSGQPKKAFITTQQFHPGFLMSIIPAFCHEIGIAINKDVLLFNAQASSQSAPQAKLLIPDIEALVQQASVRAWVAKNKKISPQIMKLPPQKQPVKNKPPKKEKQPAGTTLSPPTATALVSSTRKEPKQPHQSAQPTTPQAQGQSDIALIQGVFLPLARRLLLMQADFFEYLPYWQTPKAYKYFQQKNKQLIQYTHETEPLTQNASTDTISDEQWKTLQSLKTRMHRLVQEETTRLEERFILISEHLKPINHSEIREHIDNSQQQLTAISTELAKQQPQKFAESSEALSQAWQAIKKIVIELKNECAECVRGELKELPVTFNRPHDNFITVKQLQHEIVAYLNAYKQIPTVPQHLALYISPSRQWLATSDYMDLLLLHRLIHDRCTQDALTNQHTFYAERYQHYSEQFFAIYHCWEQQTAEIVRVHRIAEVYKAWEKKLTELMTTLDDSESPNLRTLITIHRHLTYDKKTYFKQMFANQKGIQLISSLYQLLQAREELAAPNKALNYFQKEKQTAKQRVEKQKIDLIQSHEFWQKVAAFIELAISQQPNFQLGSLLFDASEFVTEEGLAKIPDPHQANFLYSSVYNFIESCNDYLGYILYHLCGKPSVQQFSQGAKYSAGLTAFLVSLVLSNYIGYTYYSLMAVSHVTQAQFDAWVWFGEQLEKIIKPAFGILDTLTPSQYQETIRSLSGTMRFDEAGLVEKDTLLAWSTGLGILLLIQGGAFALPTTIGYTAATLAARLASYSVEHLMQEMNFSPKASKYAGIFAHFATYPMAYRQSFQSGLSFFPPPQTTMTETEALQFVGLKKGAPEKEVKRQYHSLAHQYHPDKCRFFCASEEITDISTAECVKTCRSEAPSRMAKLNEANEVLMKKTQ